MATRILKKLTIRDMVGGKANILKIAQQGCVRGKDDQGKEIILPEGAPQQLVSVFGHVTSIKPGESDMGPFCELRGAFEGTNLQTGEVTPNVSKCILPNFVGDLVAEAVASSNGKPVDFAVRIDVRYNESAATMYVFDAVSLMEAKPAESVSAIKAMLQAQGVALPAPVAKPAPQLTDASKTAANAEPAAKSTAPATAKGKKAA